MFISKKYVHLFPPSSTQEDQIPVAQNPQNLQKSHSIFLKKRKLGLSIDTSADESQPKTHKLFILTNYLLLGAASMCIFLTLSLRLIPSFCGFFLILLHITTIAGAISAANAARGATKWHGADMVANVPMALLQGSVSGLIFKLPSDFLGNLESYVREDDDVVILKLAGGLSVLIFLLEWVVLTMAFFLKRDNNAQGMRSGKVQEEEGLKYLPYPLPV